MKTKNEEGLPVSTPSSASDLHFSFDITYPATKLFSVNKQCGKLKRLTDDLRHPNARHRHRWSAHHPNSPHHECPRRCNSASRGNRRSFRRSFLKTAVARSAASGSAADANSRFGHSRSNRIRASKRNSSPCDSSNCRSRPGSQIRHRFRHGPSIECCATAA